MSDHDPATELFEHRNDPDEWEEEEAAVAVRSRRTEVVSFRLPSDELDELEQRAKDAGETLSEFIRTAIDERLHGASGPVAYDLMGGKGSVVVQLVGPLRSARATSEYADCWRASEIVPDYPPQTANLAED